MQLLRRLVASELARKCVCAPPTQTHTHARPEPKAAAKAPPGRSEGCGRVYGGLGAGVTQDGPATQTQLCSPGPPSSTSSRSAGPTRAILSFGRSLCLV